MAKQNAALFSFNQGEVSRLALARIDVAKLRLAAACQVNWSPWTLGPMMLRPGLIHIGEVLSDGAGRLVRFIFSKLDVALLEFTPNTMRVYVGEQLVTRAAVATAIADPTFVTGTGWSTAGTSDGAIAVTSGQGFGKLKSVPVGGVARISTTVSVASPDQHTEHGLRIVLQNGPVVVRVGSTAGASDLVAQTILDTGTHSLAFTPGGASFVLQMDSYDAQEKDIISVSIDAAGPLTLPTPYGQGDLPALRYDQSGDIVFMACYGFQQRKIERRSPTSWSVALYRSDDGPFRSTPDIEANFTSNVATGNGTLTSDRPFFTPDHVGSTFRLFTSGQVYATTLGANNAFTPAVRVSGVGSARNFSFTVSGSYNGALTWSRSFDGPDSGFVDVQTAASGATGDVFDSATGGNTGTPDLDNVVCWEKVGFHSGNYGNGSCTVITSYSGDGGFGIVRVLAYNSSTSVQIEILEPLSNAIATTDWQAQDWSADSGYPSSVAFFDGRLFWFGRDKFWGSRSDDFTSYADSDSSGNALGDSGALNEQFGSGPVDTVSWGLGLTRLLAGREGSVSSIRASAFDEVLTPSNISAKDCTTHGAARLPAVKVDTQGIYVDQNNRRVYKLVFNTQKLDYVPVDLTRLNLDIGKPGFAMVDVQQQPDTNVYLVREDGQIATLLDDEQDDVQCWTRMQTAGVVEDVCVLPDDGLEDLVYLIVRRVINGVTRRFIERIAHRDSATGGLLNVMADCCFSYSGTAVASVSIPWLPNTSLIVWADGQDRGTMTTDGSGNLVLGASYSNVVAGLGGKMLIGSTQDTLSNGNVPDQVFTALSNTLTISDPLYEGAPAEVFADTGGTGRLKHIGAIAVGGGKVALPNGKTASTIVAVLGYAAPFMSAKLAYAAQGGTALTQKKRVGHIGLVMQDTHAQGLKIGQRFDLLDVIPQTEAEQTTPANVVWDEYDEPMISIGGEWDTDARLCLLATAPRPVTVDAVVVDVSTSG